MTDQPVEATENEPAQPTEPEQPESREERRDEHTRGRLREVEGERDALAEKVATLLRRERDRVATDRLPEAALKLMPSEVPLNDEGWLDEEALAEQVSALLALIAEASRPHHADLGPRRTASARPAPTWGKLLGSNRGGRT